jgi:hypothetical protein
VDRTQPLWNLSCSYDLQVALGCRISQYWNPGK